ncbi:tetratricopeptide repeat protein [Methanobrevibacter sp.]|uniref:tetratricopeptide repeat protein n=1 Tax=Methanobrevibacter sp. TaxID=66852 RepID=UPI00388EA7A7
MDEWKIGDPVWWANGDTMAENYGRRDEEEEEEIPVNKNKLYSENAWQLNRQGRYLEALEEIDKALAIKKSSYNWNIKGLILVNIAIDEPEKFSQSVCCYDRALSQSPGHKTIKNNKAICLSDWAWYLQSQRQYDLALEKLDEAMPLFRKKDLDYAYALDVMGIIYHKTNNPKKARKCYDEALVYDPENEVYADNIIRLNRGLDIDSDYL